ncbi:ATP-dependent Clp protease adapter protein ClpS [alpha proteobacterium Q-1]|nr:ATP-dependent Clp protease adapter protein ClpS [alpha proteobacterium Q-1]
MSVKYISMSENEQDGTGAPHTGLLTKTEPKTKKPSMYKVLMLNDDYTPMDFVIHVLKRFFRMSSEQATQVMLHVHQKGVGVCGVFTYEIAETKATQVVDYAQKHHHPLQCTLEKE